jgi:hypothetical protein
LIPKRRPSRRLDDDFDPEFESEFDSDFDDGTDAVASRPVGTGRSRSRTGAGQPSGPGRSTAAAGRPPPSSEANAKPSRMQPPEDLVGYGVAAVLVIIGIVFATVHGKGSSKQPDTIVPLVGVVVAVALVVVIRRFANRFASAMLAVVAALLVEVAKPPTNLTWLFYVSIIVPLGWAFWITRRQSKATRAIAATQPRMTPEQRRAQRDAQKAKKRGQEPASSRVTPSPNRRYTPPQPAKPKRSRKELAAEAAEAAAAPSRSKGSKGSKTAEATGAAPRTKGSKPSEDRPRRTRRRTG